MKRVSRGLNSAARGRKTKPVRMREIADGGVSSIFRNDSFHSVVSKTYYKLDQ